MMWQWFTKAKSSKKLTEVNDFISKGHFDAVDKRAAHHSLIKWPLGKTVGLEPKYAELCKCFEMDGVGIIGIYGVGGVGKTTLLKQFYNEFLPTTQHDVVIWVGGEGPKEGDVAKIQETIKLELNIRDDIWKDRTEHARAVILYNFLKRKNFVLIIDDLRIKIDLVEELGIPLSNDGKSKIIVSTRDDRICGWVEAREFIRVEILSPVKAFELFKEKLVVDVVSSDQSINKLAKLISDECEGLPLTLIVVAKAMASETSIERWEQASETLKRFPSRFPGIVDDVYRVLEFSYHRLPNDTYKSCFLFCSLFPKDYNIDKEELVLLWTAEGYFAKYSDDIHDSRRQGQDVISRLKQACLLEDGDTKKCVKMHKIVRQMALWLACEHESKMRFVVKDDDGSSHPNRWEEVKKLSLWGKTWGRGPGVQNFFKQTHCSNLLTLLMRNFSKQDFEAFELPITIKVLDMPDNKSSSSLLSTIGRFVNLEYLNVSNSSFIKLPDQLKDLKKLRFLLLNDIAHLEFPREGAICNLLSLQAFRMVRSQSPCDESVLLDELESLMYLQDIHISIYSYLSFEKILMSPELQHCICDLEASCVFAKSSLHTFGRFLVEMFRLETLTIKDKANPTMEISEAKNCLKPLFQGLEDKIPLRKLVIFKWRIFDLDWLKFAPKLQYLELDQCDLLEEVVTEDYWVADDVKRRVFRRLTTLVLTDLPRLRSISVRALEFPDLEVISVRGCPNLKKLPFNCHSALRSLNCFMGEPDWVDQLEWEDEVTKKLFLEKFEPF